MSLTFFNIRREKQSAEEKFTAESVKKDIVEKNESKLSTQKKKEKEKK